MTSLPLAILSDMDGVLLDTERLSKRSFDEVARGFGIEDGDDIFPLLVGLSQSGHEEVFASRLPEGIDAGVFDRAWKGRFLDLLSGGAPPVKDGVFGFLESCRDLGIPVVVATSTRGAKARDFLGRAGLLPFLRGVVGGDEVERCKPHPEIYLRAAGLAGVDVGSCVALEDSSNGVLSAHGAGARVLHIPDLASASAEVRALGIEVVDSIGEVGGYLGLF